MAALDVSGQSCFTTQSIGRWGLTGGQFLFRFVVAWLGGQPTLACVPDLHRAG
jgi:hypothetical protein